MTFNILSKSKLMAVLVTALFFVPHAQAAFNPDVTWVKNANGNGYTRNLNPGSTPSTRSVSTHGPGGYTTIETPNGSTVPITRTVPVTVPVKPNGITVPVKDTLNVSKAAIASAAAKGLTRVVPLVGAGITAYQLYDLLQDEGLAYDPETGRIVKPDGDTVPTQTLYKGNGTTCGSLICTGPAPKFNDDYMGIDGAMQAMRNFAPPGPVCSATVSASHWAEPSITSQTSTQVNLRSQCLRDSNSQQLGALQLTIRKDLDQCPNGYVLNGGQCVSEGKVPATQSDIENAINRRPIDDFPKALNTIKAMQEPLEVSIETPATLTPQNSSVQGQEVTSTTTHYGENGQGETRTRTDQQVGTLTSTGTNISNNTITYNITNNYTITNNNGQVVEQSEQGQLPDPEPEDNSFVDPEFPPIPELYEQKYPDGLIGVWDAKKGLIMNTPMIEGVRNMFPTFSGGGTCPVWSFNLNLNSKMNLGIHTLQVPCALWTTIGLIILTGACFTAWGILFGR